MKQTIIFSSLYIGGILSYNIFTLYSNSKDELIEFRKTKQKFKNELDAVVAGCQKNWFDNLLLSLFWPIRVPFKLIPIIILYFNSNDSNNNNSFIQYELKKFINIKDTQQYIKTLNKIKNDNYESSKENIEYIKEKKEENEEHQNKEKESNEKLEDKVNGEIKENNLEVKEDSNKYNHNDGDIKEINKNTEIFNFSNSNEEILFDFNPKNGSQFNFSIKH